MSLNRRNKMIGALGTFESSFHIGGPSGPKIAKVGSSLQLQDSAGNPVATETLMPINAQADSYILVAADAGKVVEMAKATPQTLTVPLNATVAFAIGTQIEAIQTGAGALTIVATGGVTINSTGTLVARGRYARLFLHKTATNTWDLTGDLARTPVVFTQTFATADATLAATTGAALTDSTGATPDTTIADVPAAVAADTDVTAASLASTNASFLVIEASLSDLAAQHNALLADYDDLKRFVTSIVDALQAQGDSGIG